MMNSTRRYQSHKNCSHVSSKQARALCRNLAVQHAKEGLSQRPARIAYVTMKSGVIHLMFVDSDHNERHACTRRTFNNVEEAFQLNADSNEAVENSHFCKNCKKIMSDDTKRQSFEFLV